MRPYLLVGLGGAAGAALRWSAGELVPRNDGSFPIATFVVNVVGCALIGLAARRLTRGSDAWLVLVTGALGGLTTFSTFAVETRALLASGHTAIAFAYVAATSFARAAAAS